MGSVQVTIVLDTDDIASDIANANPTPDEAVSPEEVAAWIRKDEGRLDELLHEALVREIVAGG